MSYLTLQDLVDAVDGAVQQSTTRVQQISDALATLSTSVNGRCSNIEAALAPDYSSASTYSVGSLVYHNNKLYRCNTAISTPEAWNSAHWDASSLKDLNDSYIAKFGTVAYLASNNTFTGSNIFKGISTEGIVPVANNTYDIGSSSYKYSKLYVHDLYASGDIYTGTYKFSFPAITSDQTLATVANLSDFVTMSTSQTISGSKTFTSTVTTHDIVPGATSTYDLGSALAKFNAFYVNKLTAYTGIAADTVSDWTSDSNHYISYLPKGLASSSYAVSDSTARKTLQRQVFYTSWARDGGLSSLYRRLGVQLTETGAVASNSTQAKLYSQRTVELDSTNHILRTEYQSGNSSNASGEHLDEINYAWCFTFNGSWTRAMGLYYTLSGAKLQISNGGVKADYFDGTSDERLKTDIHNYVYSRSILDIPVKEFKWKSNGTYGMGFVAQDLQKVYPELVSEDKDGYLSIKETKLVYLLMEEVKLLRNRVEELEKKDA